MRHLTPPFLAVVLAACAQPADLGASLDAAAEAELSRECTEVVMAELPDPLSEAAAAAYQGMIDACGGDHADHAAALTRFRHHRAAFEGSLP